MACGDRQRPLSAADVEAQLYAAPDVAAVFLECPHREIGGEHTPWSEILKIRELCDAQVGFISSLPNLMLSFIICSFCFTA